MGKNRRFAKKGEEVRRFKLVARSQQDANVDDPDATPLVLEAFAAPGDARRTGLPPEQLCSIPASLQGLGPEVFGLGEKDEESDEDEDDDEEELDEETLEDLEGDCYFPRDGYNYEQHLKRITRSGQGGVGGVVMDAPKPKKGEKDLFPTEKDIAVQKPMTEEERELMAALDNASDYEEADEEFLDELMPAGAACDVEEMMWGPSAKEYKDMPDIAEWKAQYAAARGDLGALGVEGGLDFLGGETGGSAGGWRPGGPAMNDADFTAFLDKEYGDEEIGECEGEEIEGDVDLEEKLGQEILDEYIQDKVDEQEKLMSIYEPVKGKHERDDVPRTVAETKAIIENHYLVEEDDLETQDGYQDLDRETVDESRSWDCESVLSTLSNISNRPGKIANIKVVKKPGPPLQPVKEDADTAEDSGESEEEDVVELPDVNTTRRKGETAEERRERKAGVKEMRRICRRMKKESKDTYKEAAKVPAQPGTGDVRRKLRTFKIS